MNCKNCNKEISKRNKVGLCKSCYIKSITKEGKYSRVIKKHCSICSTILERNNQSGLCKSCSKKNKVSYNHNKKD